MNRIILNGIIFVLLLGNVFELFSNPVDIETAKKVAQNFMNERRLGNTIFDVVTEKNEGQDAFYVVNFKEGGWVMVSAENTTAPVFAYAIDGTYRIEEEKPSGFLYLVDGYKEQTSISRKRKSVQNNEVRKQWDQLTSPQNSENAAIPQNAISNARTYTPGRQMLNDPERGLNYWKQSGNNGGSNSCDPTYNAYAPSEGGIIGWSNDCDCGKAPIGCGAVAMGQVMWYWQWPRSSSYRTYDWDLMPNQIMTGQTAQGEAIARLLKDCGDAANMNYFCGGSFATVNNVESAMINNFNFKAARQEIRDEWGNSWSDLIRTEIDCGRPVIFKGEKSLVSGDKHYFVIDGYDALNPNLFHINFGWGGYTQWHLLNEINGDDYDFRQRQKVIIGISPTYHSPNNVNITDVSYSIVTGNKAEEARQNISLPASGKSLTVQNGSNLKLIAGNSITLQPGFQTELGSEFSTEIEPNYAEDMDIYVDFLPNTFIKGRDLYLTVHNANSFCIKIFSGTYQSMILAQNVGIVSNNIAELWDGAGFSGLSTFWCEVEFRNNFGRILEYKWRVTMVPQ